MDKEVFADSVTKYMPDMYRLALGMLRSQADAEDAVSEAVLHAYEGRKGLRKPERFKAWLMQITANEARKQYRRKKRIVSMDELTVPEPSGWDDHHELWDVVLKLELVYREVIILYFYDRMTIREIAKILRVPEGTVKSRLSRGKAVLKEMLAL